MPYLLTASPGNPTAWVKMESESIYSSRSTSGRMTKTLPKSVATGNFPSLPPLPPVPGNLTSLSNYSLSRNINNLNNINNYHQFSPGSVYANNMPHSSSTGVGSPYHTAVSVSQGHGFNHNRQNNAQINILNSDDWGDNTTAVSGMSDADLEPTFPDRSLEYQARSNTRLTAFPGYYLCCGLAILSYLSPLLMLVLPQMGIFPLKSSQLKCEVDCDGLLISFSFKMICLALASWAIFLRKPRVAMPRVDLQRCLVGLLLFVLTLTYWLFYSVRLLEQKRKILYNNIVEYSMSYLDSLIILHYLSLLLLEWQTRKKQFLVRIVRSPDGESCCLPLGNLSIQAAAAAVLDHYYTTFSIYNPYLDQLPVKSRRDNIKYYDVDGLGNYGHITDRDSRVGSPAMRSCKKDMGHNDLFYEEQDYERRLKKRRARLINSTEEAFAHIKRINVEAMTGPNTPMDSYEAAQTIFPSIVRPLQKYLRITRQQPRHTMDSILTHLANSIAHDMAPKAFLEKFLVSRPVLQNSGEQGELQTWALQSEVMLSRLVGPGTMFVMKQGQVTLLCEVLPLPHLAITETTHSPAQDKFIINRDV